MYDYLKRTSTELSLLTSFLFPDVEISRRVWRRSFGTRLARAPTLSCNEKSASKKRITWFSISAIFTSVPESSAGLWQVVCYYKNLVSARKVEEVTKAATAVEEKVPLPLPVQSPKLAWTRVGLLWSRWSKSQILYCQNAFRLFDFSKELASFRFFFEALTFIFRKEKYSLMRHLNLCICRW